MELEGEIEDIIYQNEVNSYAICKFRIRRRNNYNSWLSSIYTCRRYIKSSMENMLNIKNMVGQFKVDTFEKLMPKTLGALRKILSQVVSIKGVGEATSN